VHEMARSRRAAGDIGGGTHTDGPGPHARRPFRDGRGRGGAGDPRGRGAAGPRDGRLVAPGAERGLSAAEGARDGHGPPLHGLHVPGVRGERLAGGASGRAAPDPGRLDVGRRGRGRRRGVRLPPGGLDDPGNRVPGDQAVDQLLRVRPGGRPGDLPLRRPRRDAGPARDDGGPRAPPRRLRVRVPRPGGGHSAGRGHGPRLEWRPRRGAGCPGRRGRPRRAPACGQRTGGAGGLGPQRETRGTGHGADRGVPAGARRRGAGGRVGDPAPGVPAHRRGGGPAGAVLHRGVARGGDGGAGARAGPPRGRPLRAGGADGGLQPGRGARGEGWRGPPAALVGGPHPGATRRPGP
jgi:hypothetical protein